MSLSGCRATLAGSTAENDYLQRFERTASLEEIAQTFDLDYAFDVPRTNLTVGASVLLYENDTLVLTGLIDHVVVTRPPGHVHVSGKDRYKLAETFFIADQNLLTHNETVAWWIDYLCDLCGLGYAALPAVASTTTLGEDVPLGMGTVADALVTVATQALLNMRMLPDGTVEFVALAIPVIPDRTYTELLAGETHLANFDVRTTAKVWSGNLGSGSSAGPSGLDLLASETRDVTGSVVDQIMVASIPAMSDSGDAAALAARLLDHFAHLDHTSQFEIPGVPGIKVGESGEVDVERGNSHLSTLTDYRSVVDEKDGYQQSLTLGRKNFLLPLVPYASGSMPEDILPEPGLIWEAESVQGDAHQLAVYGGDLYICGQAGPTGNPQVGQRWRVEKRSLASGSLAWAQEFAFTSSGSEAAGLGTGVWVEGSIVYLVGIYTDLVLPGTPATALLKRLRTGDGSQLSSHVLTIPFVAATGLLSGDSTGLYVCANKIGKTNGATIWSQTYTTTEPYPVVVTRSMPCSDGLIMVGRYNSLPDLYSSRWWRGLADKGTGALVWQQKDTLTSALTTAWDVAFDPYTTGVYFSIGYEFDGGGGNLHPGLMKFGSGGTLDSVSIGDVGAHSLAVGPNRLYAMWFTSPPQTYHLRAYDKVSLDLDWYVDGAGADNFYHRYIAYWPAGPGLFSCGQKSGNFYSRRWEV